MSAHDMILVRRGSWIEETAYENAWKSQSMLYPWIMVTASSPEGGIFPHVHLLGLHLAPRKIPKGETESLEVPAFPGHWQDWALLLPTGNPHHMTMGGKSGAL